MPITNDFYVPIFAQDGTMFDEIGPFQADVDLDEDGIIEGIRSIFTERYDGHNLYRRAILSESHPLYPILRDFVMGSDSADIMDPEDLPDGPDDAKEHGFGKFEWGLT